MDTTADIKTQIEQLRRQSLSADSEQLNDIADSARQLWRLAMHGEFAEEAKTLFRELRDRIEQQDSSGPAANGGFGGQNPTGAWEYSPPVDATSEPMSDLQRRLTREKNRILSGIQADMESAVDGLGAVLREVEQSGGDAQIRTGTLQALESVGARSNQLGKKVVDLLQSGDIRRTEDVQMLINRLSPPDRGLPPEPNFGGNNGPGDGYRSAAPPTAEEANNILVDGRRLFYAGEYLQAIDKFQTVLRLDPGNREAKERIASAEDNLNRGIVPDTRVPFEARMALGRAQSLERAGRYPEAKDSYTTALNAAKDATPPIDNWQPAVDALLRIDQFILALNTRDGADILMRDDKWSDAIDQYEIVLKLNPADGPAKKNLELLTRVQKQYESARVQLATMSGSLLERGRMISALIDTIHQLRPLLPNSGALNSIDVEAQAKARTIKNQMNDRVRTLVSQTHQTGNIIENRRLLEEAGQLLDYSLLLGTEDDDLFSQSQDITNDLAKLRQAEAGLLEARKLVNSNTDPDRRKAKEVLRALRDYNQDLTYRQLVGSLLRQYLDEAEVAIRDRRLRDAQNWLVAAREEPFKVLGRSDEIWKLEQDLKTAQRQPLIRYASLGGGGLVLLLLMALLSRSWWYPAFFAPDTPTPTVTQTAVATLTQVIPTDTPTPVPPTATYTPTVTITPTRTPHYCSVNVPGGVRAYVLPEQTADSSFYLRNAEIVDVIDEQMEGNLRMWYQIQIRRAESLSIGWVQAQFLNCPEE